MLTITKKTERGNYNSFFIYFSLFFTTTALFIYETLLTRLFSTILSYSLVFIAVSFAILGSGIGAILSYKILSKGKSGKKALILASTFLPISFIASISVMYFFPFLPTFIIYIPAALLPFVLGGIVTSIIFKQDSGSSNKLYFMDLLGSGLGSLLIIKLMNSFGFVRTVIIVSIIGIVAAINITLYFGKRLFTTISLAVFILTGILLLNNSLVSVIEKNFYAYYTSPLTVIGDYKNSNNGATILFSKWDAISRTDVLDVNNKNEKYIVTDGGATAPIEKFNGNLNSVQYLKSEVNYIPFSFGKNEKSLVIGSGGGRDVLFALLGGNKKIDAVEINPSTVTAVNQFKDFDGNIYNYPGVNLYNEDGRYFIENSKDKYDNIYLSMVMTNSVQNTMYSLAEYYIFTEEAFNQYFNHLSEDGKLNFMVHNSNDLIKVVNTGIKTLMSRGVSEKDVTNYFVIVNGVTMQENDAHNMGVDMPLVIFRDKPLSKQDIASVVNTANIQNRDMIHYPGNEIEPYKSLKDGKMTYNQLLNLISFNSKPITDDSPFFYNNSKFIPVEMIFIIISILVIWIIIRLKFIKTREYRKTSTYFAALGIAYMLIEIPLIQKTVLYFGSSSIAFSFTIFSLLISSGIGSYVSGSRIIEKLAAKFPYYILAAAIMIVVNQLVLNSILNTTKDWQMVFKFLIIFLSLLPMGFFMGMAFPSGIKKIGRLKEDDALVPLMIGVNGIFSVLGSILAVAISMKFGFTSTIFISAAIYVALFILNPLQIYNSNNLV